MIYKLFVPKQAVGADLVYFDCFNPGGVGFDMELLSVQPVVSGAVAVTGVVAVDLLLTRTSAVGTGGTAATTEGSSTTAMTFTAVDNSQPVALSTMSARLTPTGGATAGAVLGWTSVFTEETNGGAYTPSLDLVDSPILIPGATGFRVVQGAVASVGNIGFNVRFKRSAR